MLRTSGASPALCLPSCSSRPTLQPRQQQCSRRGGLQVARAEPPKEEKRASSDPLAKLSQVGAAVQELFTDDNILDYCSLDNKGGRPTAKMSLGEKESEFLNALASFYYDDKPTMNNEEFDNLKEELIWEGSQVAVLSPTEQRFMEASLAYTAKKPIISDDEYDKLKGELREQSSKVVQQGPRCSLRSRTMYSDASADYLKLTLLNIPAALTTLLALFSVDDITGFRITQVLELPQPWGILITWGVVLPLVFLVSSALTNAVFKDALILQGNCPNCGKGTQTYFGDILIVQGPRETNTVTCDQCKSKMEFNALKRWILIRDVDDDAGKKNKPASKAPPKKQQDSKQPQPA